MELEKLKEVVGNISGGYVLDDIQHGSLVLLPEEVYDRKVKELSSKGPKKGVLLDSGIVKAQGYFLEGIGFEYGDKLVYRMGMGTRIYFDGNDPGSYFLVFKREDIICSIKEY